MNADKALEVIGTIRADLQRRDISSVRLLDERREPALRHVFSMLDRMEVMIKDQANINAKIWEKVQRWLGFVQGVLWTYGCFSIDELRKMNSSDGKDHP